MSFDPDKYLKQTAPAAQGFDPDAYLQQSAPTQPADVQDVGEQEELVGEITQNELDVIVKKHKLSPEQKQKLKDNIAFFGTKLKGEEQSVLDQAQGFISDAVGLGVPQKYVIETADTEEMKNALDDLRQLADSRKSGWRTAAEIGTGLLVPGGGVLSAAKLGARAAKAAKAGAILGTPAVEMAAHSKRGEELEGAAIGATAGAVLGFAAPKIIKSAGKLKSKKLQKSVEEALDKMPNIDDKIDQKLLANKTKFDIERKALQGKELSNEEMKTYLGPSLLNDMKATTPADIQAVAEEKIIQRLEDFEKFTKKDMSQMEREGEEFMSRQYDRFLKSELAEEVIAETGLRGQLVPISGFKSLAFKFSDNKPLAKIMDARLGTNIERTLDEMSKKHNLYTVGLGDNLTKLAKLRKQSHRVPEEAIYRALDTGERGDVPEEIFNAWKDFFAQQRELAIEMGMPIKKLENYVPKRRLSLVKYTSAIKRKAEDIAKKSGYKISELDPGEFTVLKKDPEFQDLLNEVKFTSGIDIDAADIFNREFNKMIHNPGATRSALALDAFASKAREGEIPDFVLDKAVGNLASKWMQSTFRSIALRDGIEELKRASQIARKAGDDFTHKHIEALVQDVIGSRGDTVGRAAADLGNKFLVGMQVKADKAKNPIAKSIYEGTANLPQHINGVMRQIYPNYLGLNPKSVLQNLTSPTLFIVPDMGTGYGTLKNLQGMVDILATKKHGQVITLSPETARIMGRKAGDQIRTKNLNLIMHNEGILPKQWEGEMVEALKEGLKYDPAHVLARKVGEVHTKTMMGAFEWSEKMARSIAYFMGKRIGSDMVKDPDWAKGFIAKVDSPSYQRALTKSLAAGDVKETQKLMVDFLNSNNMFNYDRINMSAYGRYMGPMFSVFSKWPTSIAGRIMSDYERKGLIKGTVRNAQTLMAPFALLSLVDAMTQDEESDLSKRLVGQGGLRAWTPVDSTFSLFEEGIGKSPAIESIQEVVKSVTQENKSFNNAMQNTFNTYTPGSGLLRFLGEDLPVYRGRAKPEGPKIERRLKEVEKYLK